MADSRADAYRQVAVLRPDEGSGRSPGRGAARRSAGDATMAGAFDWRGGMGGGGGGGAAGRLVPRRWAWIPFVAAVAIAPVALAPFCELPFLAFAATPMAIYLGVWVFFRQLDSPPAPRPPPRDDGPPKDPPRRLTPAAPGRGGEPGVTAARRRAPVA